MFRTNNAPPSSLFIGSHQTVLPVLWPNKPADNTWTEGADERPELPDRAAATARTSSLGNEALQSGPQNATSPWAAEYDPVAG